MSTLAPCPLQQSSLYAAGLARIGAEIRWYDTPDGPVLALTRRLPGLGRSALISRLATAPPVDLRRRLGARALVINAESPRQGATLARAGFIRLAAGRDMAQLSLVGTPEDWLARMDGKWRNRLRHAERRGLEVRAAPLPPDPNHWLLHREAAQQSARGYRNLPPALIAAMSGDAPGALALFTARAGGRIIAAMLFARHGATASYLIGWSGADGRAASAHNLLLWHAMRDLRADGAMRLDLGLCDRQRAPGLARFKCGSGAALHRLGGTWVEIGPLAPLHAGLRVARRPRLAAGGTGAPCRAAPSPPRS